jgi:ferredoxin-type protein NapG
MTMPDAEKLPEPLPTLPPSPPPTEAALAHTPVARSPKKEPPQERRDFFGEAMREVLAPFATLIERKITPILAALEQIPDTAENLASTNFGLLDQPQTRALPQHPIQKEPERFLRPPGAMMPGGAAGFESVCSRCGNCVAACPANAIKLDANGLVAEGFPYIVADEQPCVVSSDLACMKSCPTGALKLVDRLQINMGTAAVNHETCLRNHGEDCTLCVDVCPIDAHATGGLSALFISPETGKVRVRRNVCVGCGMCENRCPTEPRSIVVNPYVAPVDPIVA